MMDKWDFDPTISAVDHLIYQEITGNDIPDAPKTPGFPNIDLLKDIYGDDYDDEDDGDINDDHIQLINS